MPVVLEYDTNDASLFPPEGLFVDACVLYQRGSGGAKVEVRTESGDIALDGKRFQLAKIRLALAISWKSAPDGSRSPGS